MIFHFDCDIIFWRQKKPSTKYAPVAQLDRVFGYEPKGQGFESLPARQNSRYPFGYLLFLCFGWDFEPEGFGDAAKKARSLLSLPKSRARQTILGTARSGQNRVCAEYPFTPKQRIYIWVSVIFLHLVVKLFTI